MGRRRIGWRFGIGLGMAGFGAIEALCMDGLEAGQELEAQQMAERKRHGALPVTIHVLPVHFHGRAVA
jgi:hypothetical protein